MEYEAGCEAQEIFVIKSYEAIAKRLDVLFKGNWLIEISP